MRTYPFALLLILPLCSAIEAPKSFLRTVEDSHDGHRLLIAQRSLGSCPVCAVTEDAEKELGGIRGFFSRIANMARSGMLRSIWNYFQQIGRTIVTSPQSVDPISLIESFVLFMDQMGLSADSMAELKVQADGKDLVVDTFDIIEDIIRSLQAAVTGVADILRNNSVFANDTFTNLVLSVLGVVEEITLSFFNVIVNIFDTLTGKRRHLKEEGGLFNGGMPSIPEMFDGLINLLGKLTLLSQAAGIDDGLTAVLASFQSSAEGMYNRLQLFWTILNANTVQADTFDETASQLIDQAYGVIQGVNSNMVTFVVDFVSNVLELLPSTDFSEVFGVVESIFAGVKQFLGLGDWARGDSSSLMEVVTTPAKVLGSTGCERDRLVCLAKAL